MKEYYVIIETNKDDEVELERARFDSVDEALNAFQNYTKRADKEARKESEHRNDPYWHTYSLDNVEVDEDGEAEYTDRIKSFKSKTYQRGVKIITTKQELLSKFHYNLKVRTTKKKLEEAHWEPYEDEYEKCIGTWVTLIPVPNDEGNYNVRIFGKPDDDCWYDTIYKELRFLES